MLRVHLQEGRVLETTRQQSCGPAPQVSDRQPPTEESEKAEENDVYHIRGMECMLQSGGLLRRSPASLFLLAVWIVWIKAGA